MPFIKSFTVNTEKQNPFPYNIPAVQFAKNILLDNKVTIFAGDNGCGKSTLLEAIAFYLRLPLIGGQIQAHPGLKAARVLHPNIEIEWKRQLSRGFFFRAEDFSDFINAVGQERNKIASSPSGLKGQVDDAIIDRIVKA